MILRKFHTFQILLREKPVNLKGKTHSSQQWIVRQMKDPYVEKAKQENYRCRSAFKLLEINKRFNLLKPGINVIDCGAAPGSWTQVAVHLTNANGKMFNEEKGKVIGIDKLPIHPIDGAILFGNSDFTEAVVQKYLLDSLDGKFADLVLSDMAPNATGSRELDHQNIIKLAYSAFKFALEISCHDATFLVKVWDGYMSLELEQNIAKFYKHIKIVKPGATRQESSEKYILARGFKGLRTQTKKNH